MINLHKFSENSFRMNHEYWFRVFGDLYSSEIRQMVQANANWQNQIQFLGRIDPEQSCEQTMNRLESINMAELMKKIQKHRLRSKYCNLRRKCHMAIFRRPNQAHKVYGLIDFLSSLLRARPEILGIYFHKQLCSRFSYCNNLYKTVIIKMGYNVYLNSMRQSCLSNN